MHDLYICEGEQRERQQRKKGIWHWEAAHNCISSYRRICGTSTMTNTMCLLKINECEKETEMVKFFLTLKIVVAPNAHNNYSIIWNIRCETTQAPRLKLMLDPTQIWISICIIVKREREEIKWNIFVATSTHMLCHGVLRRLPFG